MECPGKHMILRKQLFWMDVGVEEEEQKVPTASAGLQGGAPETLKPVPA